MASFNKLQLENDGSNDYYLLPKGSKLYRADDKKINIQDYRPRFFALNQGDVKSYGKTIYEFTTIIPLKLLALDKNITNFYNSCPKDIKKILRNQYGYKEDNTKSKRLRDSSGNEDNILTNYICENANEYNGYATEEMEKVEKFNSFHDEIAICDSNSYSQPTIISNLSKEDTYYAQKDARLIEMDKETAINRKKRPQGRFFPESPTKIHKGNKFMFEDSPSPLKNKLKFGDSPQVTPIKMNFSESAFNSPNVSPMKNPFGNMAMDISPPVTPKKTIGGKIYSRRKGRKYKKRKTKKNRKSRKGTKRRSTHKKRKTKARK